MRSSTNFFSRACISLKVSAMAANSGSFMPPIGVVARSRPRRSAAAARLDKGFAMLRAIQIEKTATKNSLPKMSRILRR